MIDRQKFQAPGWLSFAAALVIGTISVMLYVGAAESKIDRNVDRTASMEHRIQRLEDSNEKIREALGDIKGDVKAIRAVVEEK